MSSSYSNKPVSLADTLDDLLSIHSEIKSLLYKLGYDGENIQFNRNNPEEFFLYEEYRMLADTLSSVDYKLAYLAKPILEEGYLSLNSLGRYELPSGYDLTSGSTCEILIYDEFDEVEKWLLTSIEHDSDYYPSKLGTKFKLDGAYVRVRNSF